MAKRVTRRFELLPTLQQQGSEITLGGYGAGEPPRVVLTKRNPTVTGDAYGQYLPTGFVREIEPLVEEVGGDDGDARSPAVPRAQRVFELTDDVKRRGQQHKLGGYGAGDPPVVYLDAKNPTVTGDAYAIYLPLGILREVTPQATVKTAARTLLEGRGKVSAPSAQTLAEEAMDRLTPIPASPPVLPEEVLPVEEIAQRTPAPEDLERMSRPELEDLARRLGVWDKVPGSGPNGYRNTEDLLRYFGVTPSPSTGSEGDPLPRSSQIKKMSKDQLVKLAERLGVLDDIPKTGASGDLTARDLMGYLIPLVESKTQAGDDGDEDAEG